ncbi:unnamed protein product [Ascophyllum nodosum]
MQQSAGAAQRKGHMRASATKVLAFSAMALVIAARTAMAASPECEPLDLTKYNLTDYIRWSTTSDRLYLEKGACVTLTDIWEARVAGPVYPFDDETGQLAASPTGSWYIGSSLYIQEGSTLMIQGTDFGGDCDHLMLASRPDKVINMRAHGGNIWIEGTHVESLNIQTGEVDDDYEDGRSYISAISEVITNPSESCVGMAKNDRGEARLDILDSEINHLGWYDAESYGIVYKVRGFCNDGSNPEVFDDVEVTGDILRSHIHHLYFGHYSFGHQGGDFSYNHVHDNAGYGFDPHDDSDYLTIHNNHVHDNGWHGIIASKRCDHVSIQNNVVHDNGKNGLMLHRSCDYATVKNNTAYGNADSGLAVYESSHCEVSDNTFYWNKYGIRLSMGSSNNNAYNNKIVVNGEDERYTIFLYRGADEPEVEGSDGRPRHNHLYDNTLISDYQTLKIMSSDENTIEGNVMTGSLARFTDSFDNLWVDNDIPDVFEFKMQEGACFDADSDLSSPNEAYGEIFNEDYSYTYDADFDDDGFFCS